MLSHARQVWLIPKAMEEVWRSLAQSLAAKAKQLQGEDIAKCD